MIYQRLNAAQAPRKLIYPLLCSLVALNAQADHPITTLGDSAAGAINTPSATTAAAGALGVSLQFQVIEFEPLTDAQIIASGGHSTDRVLSPSLAFSWGLTDKLSLGASLPYVERQNFRQSSAHEHANGDDHAHGEDPSGTGAADLADEVFHGAGELADPTGASEEAAVAQSVGDISGLGDATVYAQYNLWNDGRSAWSVLGGLKLPTGRTDVQFAGELIETAHQPGSGSTDYLLGVIASHRLGDWALDGAVSWLATTVGDQDTEMGDVLNYNLSLARRFSGGGDAHHAPPASFAGGGVRIIELAEDADEEPGHDHSSHDHSSHDHGAQEDFSTPVDEHLHWDLVLELNGERRGQDRVGGRGQSGTGSHVLYFSPGARLAMPGGWNATVSLGVPVLIDLQGLDSEPQLRLLCGLSKAL